MRRTGFWKTDWFLELIVSGAMLAASGTAFVHALERRVFELTVPWLLPHLLETSWSMPLVLAAVVLAAAYLIAVLPRLSVRGGIAATLFLMGALLAGQAALALAVGVWAPLLVPLCLLLVGHLLLGAKRLLAPKPVAEGLPDEAARRLGQSLLRQGRLEQAFDALRQCAVDDALMEDLYRLALDFERQRQFPRAEAVLRLLAAYNADFRDVRQRLARIKPVPAAKPTAVAPADAATPSSRAGAGPARLTLGRYRIEKELGRGAMGVVFFGRDTKSGRTAAIKTLALSQEFDPEELADVKARFFREAETAGRLQHPNIVSMYDAGEENELAYLAMEFLHGADLVPFTRPGRLLPMAQVVSIVARVADALAYAHRHHVVHRDVKPANVMYEPDADVVKVTDFGIARITDSSRTKTGMVLGTPSYMSPEQLSGKKIDGRSDLFSLGVMLYQLLCGRLPFVGESMTQLMYKIANDPCVDIRTVNPKVPDALAAIVERALCKDVAQRYQTGEALARDLWACLPAVAQRVSEVDIQL